MRVFDEKVLVNKLDKILKKEFGTNLSFHEFSAGYGIADLVFASEFSFRKNVVKRNPLTNFNTLKILLTLKENKTYRFEDLLKVFDYLTPTEIKSQIRVLMNNNYLKQIEKNLYAKLIEKGDLNPIRKVIAIEVKLSDHKSGLTQARRYQYFADESYLAILKEAEKNINYDEFNKYNIGLILFDNKSGSIEIKRPRNLNNNYERSVGLFAKEVMMSKYLNPAF